MDKIQCMWMDGSSHGNSETSALRLDPENSELP